MLIKILIISLVLVGVTSLCLRNCQSCPNSITCTTCISGYFLRGTSECLPCPQNCQTCSMSSSQTVTCSQCVSGALFDSNNRCIFCHPSCKTCSGFSNNCTSCYDGSNLANNTLQYYCYNPNTCSISQCQSCTILSTNNSVCNSCSQGLFNFRRQCDHCKFPCSSCSIDLQTLWDNQVLPYWNQNRQNLKNKILNPARLLQRDEEDSNDNNDDRDGSDDGNNHDDGHNNDHRNRDNYDRQNPNVPYADQRNDNGYDEEGQRYDGKDNYTQTYINWNATTWNSSSWTSQNLAAYNSMNKTRAKGWIQAYFFFKAVSSVLNSSANITQIIYKCLPIMQQLINLTNPKSKQWNHLARFANNVTGQKWSGKRLQNKVISLASSKTVCQGCAIGFYFNFQKSTCQICQINCFSCTAQNSCTACSSGYFLNQGNCQMCSEQCAQCSTSSTQCTACKFPLTLTSNSRCILCSSYSCDECDNTNTSKCLKCKSQFSLTPNSQGQCYRCKQIFCSQCLSSNTSSCLTCIDGFGIYNTNNTCVRCPTNCASCSISENAQSCLSCRPGFTLVGTGCQQCQNGCLQCAATYTSTCIKCFDGLYLNTVTATCQRCMRGCLTCNDSQSCLSYHKQTTFYQGSLTACQTGCLQCDYNDPSKCLACGQKFYLDSNICTKCPQNCRRCTSSTACTSCIQGAVIEGSNCLKCPDNCLSCTFSSNAYECKSCIAGYKLQNKLCSNKCSQGCASCLQNSTCIKCSSGYALSQLGNCIKCLANCQGTCDPKNITICYECSKGFQMQNGLCKRCPRGCSNCVNGQCSSCVKNYRQVEGSGSFQCVKQCVYPCVDCQTTTKCSRCAIGFTLDSSTSLCVPDLSCNPNCETCVLGTFKDVTTQNCTLCSSFCSICTSSSGSCKACFDGYYLSSGVCSTCNSPCLTCYDEKACKTCQTGYVLQVIQLGSQNSQPIYNNTCIPCVQGCKTCQITPDLCFNCLVGYILRGTKCVSNYLVSYEYKLSRNYTQFLQNSQSANFSQALCKKLGIDSKRNIIQYIRQGSTIVGGVITTANYSQAQNINQSLQSTGSTIGNYTVISKNVDVMYNNQRTDNNEQNGSKSGSGGTSAKKIGIIVGATIGAVILLIILGCIICRCCKKKQDHVDLAKASDGDLEQADDKIQIVTAGISQNFGNDKNVRSTNSNYFGKNH